MRPVVVLAPSHPTAFEARDIPGNTWRHSWSSSVGQALSVHRGRRTAGGAGSASARAAESCRPHGQILLRTAPMSGRAQPPMKNSRRREHSYALTCEVGEEICYGASDSESNKRYWGIGFKATSTARIAASSAAATPGTPGAWSTGRAARPRRRRTKAARSTPAPSSFPPRNNLSLGARHSSGASFDSSGPQQLAELAEGSRSLMNSERAGRLAVRETMTRALEGRAPHSPWRAGHYVASMPDPSQAHGPFMPMWAKKAPGP